MYKALVRSMIRRNVAHLNAGDAGPLLALAAPDAVIAFPGDNSWSTMFRPVAKGRRQHVTHLGIEECRAFADRFVAEGITFEVEDILVNGPPWNMRIALRVHDFAAGGAGADTYNNRAVAFLELRWGRLTSWEDYEDTERVAAWDRARTESAAG